MNYTDAFLDNLQSFSEKELSIKSYDKLKHLLLDYIGVTVAGSFSTHEKIESLLANSIDSDGSIPLIGLSRTVNIEKALLINGLNAHALDFDDGTNTGIIHLGSPVFTVLLPLLQHGKASVHDFWKAAALGYETSFTIAVSIQPMHKQNGYHATGTCGTIGVAMAVAYMLGYNKKQKKDAFSAAALAASGSLKALEDGSDYKPYNVAKAALNGYNSALMGVSGYNAPDDVMDGFQGFIKQMTGEDQIVFKEPLYLGTSAVEKAYIKPYAACRYCHPAIGAMIDIRNETDLDVNLIKSIRIRTYKWAVNNHDHTDIKGVTSAKMSIPYSVAVALLYGKAGMEEYEMSYITQPIVKDLTSKVIVEEDEALTAAFPKITTAICEINMTDGSVVKKRVDFPKGEPENPMSEEEVKEKFRMLTRYAGMNDGVSERIINIIDNFDDRYMELFDALKGGSI